MASLRIRCGGRNSFGAYKLSDENPSGRISQLSCSMIVNRSNSEGKRRGISMVMTAVTKTEPIWSNLELFGKQEKGKIGYENLEEWMGESVVEIVKNLRKAPLLVQVFSEKEGETRLKAEKAAEENWLVLKENWENREIPMPEGVIFVDELYDKKEPESESEGEDVGGEERGESKAWGIVVQGKGVERGPVCYLLKTSQVGSGSGIFSTHFSLVRVSSFRESVKSQLKSCWLL